MRFHAFKALFAVTLFSGALTTVADQFQPLPVEALSSNAQLIVHGTVLSKTVQRDSEGRIFTSIELAVHEVWKGQVTSNHITLVRGGGVLGDEGLEVSGEAEYEVGEELVSFLVLNHRGQPLSFAMAQGKFRVWQDSVTGEKVVSNGVHGARSGAVGGPGIFRSTVKRLTFAELKTRAQGGGK